ncbi:MAG: alpha/beta hydrolase [Lentisphaeria bacterium]
MIKSQIIKGVLKSGKTFPSPDVECWLPENKHRGIGLVIFPGGGYGGLAEHEGKGYADYFASAGIASFVVSYRLGTEGFRHPAMLEDALAAIGTVRSAAREYGIDPQRIGIMGSSAGGHLAAHTLVAWNRYESDISLRPDFGILCYPVIASRGPNAHKGSIDNLAGDNPPPDLLDELACEKHVSPDTPPCFLWHTGQDSCVPLENSLLFASALRTHHVPFELHLYQKGRHGLGLEAPFDWGAECLRWITETLQLSDRS